MVKLFHSKHRHIRNPFLSRLQESSSQKSAPTFFDKVGKGLQEFEKHTPAGQFRELRKTKKGRAKLKKIGQLAEKGGKILEAIGTVTAQPELVGLGLGLEVGGDILEGGTDKEIARRLIETGIGAVAGNVVGGGVGGIVAGQVASGVTNELFDALDSQGEITDRTHNQQIGTQIKENQHMDDKEQHHNQVQLPSDLQGTGQVATNVGSKLNADPNDVVKTVAEFEEDIDLFDSGVNVLEFMLNNFQTFEHLANTDKDEILTEVLNSGLLTNLLAELS